MGRLNQHNVFWRAPSASHPPLNSIRLSSSISFKVSSSLPSIRTFNRTCTVGALLLSSISHIHRILGSIDAFSKLSIHRFMGSVGTISISSSFPTLFNYAHLIYQIRICGHTLELVHRSYQLSMSISPCLTNPQDFGFRRCAPELIISSFN